MKYTSLIDNVTSKKWGLSIQEAYLFEWIYSLPSWANKAVIDDNVFYFASKNKAIEELPLLTDKPDTMYRYYKSLEKKELILISKIGGKDYVCLTEKSKAWNRCKSEYSENNPNKLGNKSENNSENNPTYNKTIKDKITKDNVVVTPEQKNEVPEFVQQQQQEFKKEIENSRMFDIEQTKEYLLTENEVWRQFRKWTDVTHREIFEKVLNEFLKVELGNEGSIYPRPKGKSLIHFSNWTKKRLADTPKLFTIEKEEEKKKIYVATSAEETPEQKAIRKQREQDEIDAIRKLKEESDRRQTDTNAKPKTLNDFLPNFLSA